MLHELGNFIDISRSSENTTDQVIYSVFDPFVKTAVLIAFVIERDNIYISKAERFWNF